MVNYIVEINLTIFSRRAKKKFVNRAKSQACAFLTVREVLMPHRLIKILQIPNYHFARVISSCHHTILGHTEPAYRKGRFDRTIFKNDLCSIAWLGSLNQISDNQLSVTTAGSNHVTLKINTDLGASVMWIVVCGSQFDLITAKIQKTYTSVITGKHNQSGILTEANVRNTDPL